MYMLDKMFEECFIDKILNNSMIRILGALTLLQFLFILYAILGEFNSILVVQNKTIKHTNPSADKICCET